MKKKKTTLCVLTPVLSLIACVTAPEAPKVFADEGSTLGFSGGSWREHRHFVQYLGRNKVAASSAALFI